MNTRLFKTLAVLVALLSTALTAWPYDVSYDGIYYTLADRSDGTGIATVVNNGSFNTYSGNLVIPQSITHNDKVYTVTTIGYQALKNSTELTSVSLPNTIEYMSNEAFAGCTSLTTLTIPPSIFSIYNYVFKGCTGLTSITCMRPDPRSTNTNNFDADTYANATLYVPKGSLSSYQNTAPWSSFANIQESDVFIVDGIYYRIIGTNKVEVTYKERLENYYKGSVNIPSVVSFGGVTYNVTGIGNSAFTYSTELTAVTIPNSVTSIGYGAFYGCSTLPSIIIPNSVTNMGMMVFQNCQALSSVTLSNNLNRLPQQAFDSCSSLTSISIPSSVKSIDPFAFYHCTNLRTVLLNEGLENIYDDVFSGCDRLTELNIPASVNLIAGSIVNDCLRIRRFIVNSNNADYTEIDGVLFTKDKKTLVSFPNANCSNYIVPDGTVEIGRSAFSGCRTVLTVKLPRSLTKIDDMAFLTCNMLKEIVVPKGVETIKSWSFARIPGLKTVDLPETITELECSAFAESYSIERIVVRATTPPICQTMSDEIYEDLVTPFSDSHFYTAQLVVPRGCKALYQSAPIWNNFADIVEEDFAPELLRGDVDGDGMVGIADVSALIDYLLAGSNIIVQNADLDLDGRISIADISTLIDYILGVPFPAEGIDLWYLWGNFIGYDTWGYETGQETVGVSVLPMYPDGNFNAQGQGILTWTSYIPRGYFSIIHHPGYLDEMWVVDSNGNYLVINDAVDGDDPEYQTLLFNTGYYTMTLNTAAKVLIVDPYTGAAPEYGTITIAGEFNSWECTATPLLPVNSRFLGEHNHDWYLKGLTFDRDGEVKFCANNGWNTNWGAISFPYGTGVFNGYNIPVSAGTYDVFFNDITGQYNFIPVK